MTRGHGWGWLLAASMVSSPAAARGAGHHQICFQSSDGTYTDVVGILRCRADDPAVSCTIAVPAAQTTTAYATVGNETSLLATFASSGAFMSTISFSDGVTRACTLETIPPNLMAPSYALPSLLGYTTDSSGLVMTGVWAQSWVVFPAVTEAELPVGFRAVGGGASGKYVTAAMSEYPQVWYAADAEPWGNFIPVSTSRGTASASRSRASTAPRSRAWSSNRRRLSLSISRPRPRRRRRRRRIPRSDCPGPVDRVVDDRGECYADRFHIPASVDGHLFETIELRRMLVGVPNTNLHDRAFR